MQGNMVVNIYQAEEEQAILSPRNLKPDSNTGRDFPAAAHPRTGGAPCPNQGPTLGITVSTNRDWGSYSKSLVTTLVSSGLGKELEILRN